MNHPKCVSPVEGAKILGVSKTTMYYRLLREGENAIPHIRVGRRILIPVSELDRWLKKNAVR